MDDSELVKAGMEVALKPVTEIAENILGRLGGDWISENRTRNRERLKEQTAKILSDRGAKIDGDISPSIVVPLLSMAQEESREDLQDLWARLLATAMDPKTRHLYRREFADIAKQLEPLDALLLPHLNRPDEYKPNRVTYFALNFGRSTDEIEISMDALARKGLAQKNAYMPSSPQPTPLGRQFLAAVS